MLLVTTLIFLMMPFSFAAAEEDSASRSKIIATPPCTLNENANINLSFNSVEKTVDGAVSYVDKKINDVKALVKKGSADKVTITGINYNINPLNNGDPSASDRVWQVSGNLSLSIVPASKGKDILVLLNGQGYQPSLNVNSYRNDGCQ